MRSCETSLHHNSSLGQACVAKDSFVTSAVATEDRNVMTLYAPDIVSFDLPSAPAICWG